MKKNSVTALAVSFVSALLLSQIALGAKKQVDSDSDGDGIFDRYEKMLGTDLHDPKSKPSDLDKDGIPDDYDLDIDGDGVSNWQDPFPKDPQEFADVDGDGVGDTKDKDSDGDGFSNAEEKAAGTNPFSKKSFPDDSGPVVDLVALPKVVEERVVQIRGMALDTGMGVDKVQIVNEDGDIFKGHFLYTTHFSVKVRLNKGMNQLQLAVTDKANNLTRQLVEVEYQP